MLRETLTKLMRSSWLIERETGMGRSFCLRKAWSNIKLQKALRTGVVRFSYMKIDGGVREARGTTSSTFVPYMGTPSDRKENLKVVTYYDLDKNGWRSFRRENLIGITN